jgi:nicotinate-nucleotide adenylyltransferase
MQLNETNNEIKKDLLRVGISGGTFDPIHLGHLIIAQEVKEAFDLDSIFFIPVGNPPHKDTKNVSPANLRLRMVNKAINSNKNFKILDLEVKRKGYTYAIDTLNELSQLYQNTKFYYIIGADVVFEITTWRNFEAVFKLCEFISVLRPKFEKEKYFERIAYLSESYGAVIHSFEASLVDISSTNIREKVRNGYSIKYYVPPIVEKFILEKRLYR